MFSLTKSWLSKCMIIIVWVVSYIVIMLFPLLASTFSFVSGNNIIRTYINENFRLSANILANNMDHLLLVNLKLANQMTSDNELLELCAKMTNSPDNYSDIARKTQQLLQSVKISNDNIDNIVLFTDKDIVIYDNGFCTLSQYYSSYFADSENSVQSFKRNILGKSESGFQFLDNYCFHSSIAYISDFSLPGGDSSFGKIMIISDYQSIAEKNKLSGASFLITEENKILASDRNADVDECKNIIDQGGTNRFAMQATHSKVLPSWNYYYLDNIEKIASIQKSYKTVTYISYITSIILGILFMLIFISYNSLHIKKILSYIKRQLKTEKINYSYNFIESGIENIEKKNNELALQYINQQSLIQSYQLSQWLFYGRIPENFMEIIDFDSNSFVVLLVNVIEPENGQTCALPGSPSTVILNGFIENNLSKVFSSVNMVEFDNVIGFILGCVQGTDFKTNIEKTMTLINRATVSDFGAELNYCCSSVHRTAAEVNVAYNEAMEVMTFQTNYPSDAIFFYNDMSFSKDKSYYYPIEIERKLIDCILQGNASSARDIIENLYTLNITQKCLPVNISKCFMLDILSSVIKSLSEVSMNSDYDINGFIEENNPIDRIMHSTNLAEIKAILCSFSDELCIQLIAYTDSHSESISDRAKQIIKECYTDCNLSSTYISDKLNLSRDYFLRLFKAQKNISVSDYLNHVRIEAACVLLKENELTIGEVASNVGYSNIKTFNRVFTKITGITPGKYRSDRN